MHRVIARPNYVHHLLWIGLGVGYAHFSYQVGGYLLSL